MCLVKKEKSRGIYIYIYIYIYLRMYVRTCAVKFCCQMCLLFYSKVYMLCSGVTGNMNPLLSLSVTVSYSSQCKVSYKFVCDLLFISG